MKGLLPKDRQASYLLLFEQWLSLSDASTLYQTLADELSWQQPQIVVYGKTHKIPRLQSWQGSRGQLMRYSQQDFVAEPFHPALLPVVDRLNALLFAQTNETRALNSVLINWYRNGQDGMGWHSDDEPELGVDPTIASLSLGATRNFDFRERQNHAAKIRYELATGDLLIMKRGAQSIWQHALPKTKRVKAGRINLTFRHIMERS